MDKEIEALKEALLYDAETGALVWRKRMSSRAAAGSQAGCIDGQGYRTLIFQGKQYLAHRVVWALVHGAWPGEIDHKDRDKSNNRINNLVDCSHYQNCLNRDHGPIGKSGVRGVHHHKQSGRWFVQYRHKGKNHYVGMFPTVEAAAKAYREAKEKTA